MSRRVSLALLLSVVLTFAVSFPGASQPPQTPVNETPSAWFVELAGAPLSDVDAAFTSAQRQNYLRTLGQEKQAFRNAARAAGVSFREMRSFDVLFNGLSVDVTARNLPALARLPGVKAVWPVLTFAVPPTTGISDPELATALAMTGADIAQSELGYTGAGVRVAIMDTGIDYHHPDLGGCFGPGCRVFTGHDFVGDAFNADPTSSSYNPVPVPDPNPDDCHGHGTHVAGIVGANGTVKGVAPGVTFGAYRVFGC